VVGRHEKRDLRATQNHGIAAFLVSQPADHLLIGGERRLCEDAVHQLIEDDPVEDVDLAGARDPVLESSLSELLRIDRALHRVAGAQDSDSPEALFVRLLRHHLGDVQPGERRLGGDPGERDVDRVVGADQEVGPKRLELARRGQHEAGHLVPSIAVDRSHVLGQAVGVEAHLRMSVGTQALAPVERDRPVAQGRPLGAAGHDSDVRGHSFLRLQS
jgi:hypothetical protein